MSVTYGGDKITFDDGSTISSGYTLFRNRIINGAMEIDQRNNGSATTAHNSFSADRLGLAFANNGAFSLQQVTTAPTGFKNSVRFTVTTADSSLGTDQYLFVRHNVEGTNISDLDWGTANAKTVTLSFWVRSSVTGTYCVNLRNSAADRNYIAEYTINSADTWEYKTVTVPGDTTGTWLTTNGIGIQIRWTLGIGTDYQGSTGWTASNDFGTSNQTNLAATLNATWYMTGAQLEVGSYATTFERRPYGLELQLCQRYYFNINGGDSGGYTTIGVGGATSTTNSRNLVQHPVVMRTQPTVSSLGGGTYSIQAFDSTGSGATIASVSQPSRFTSYINFTTSGITAYNPTVAQLENTTSYTVGIQFSAEL